MADLEYLSNCQLISIAFPTIPKFGDLPRDFSHEILFAGEDIHKKIVQSKIELKNTGLGQNKKYFGWEDGPIFFGEVKF